MKKIINNISFKVSIYLLLALFLTLAVSGSIIAYKFARIQDKNFYRQTSLLSGLISNGTLSFETVNDIITVARIIQAKPDECLIIGLNNKIYYSIDPLQINININDIEKISIYKPKLFSLTNRLIFYEKYKGSKYLVNISPLYIEKTKLAGYLLLKVNAHSIQMKKIRFILFFGFISFMGILLSGFLLYIIFNKNISKRFKNISVIINHLKSGKFKVSEQIEFIEDEIGLIEKDVYELAVGLEEKARFANEIEKGNFNYNFKLDNLNDQLAKALIDMRDNLKKSSDETKKREIEDYKRNWAAEGIAKFNDILRQHIDDINELSYIIISNLVKYVKASQASIFLVNKDNESKPYLELIAVYAFDIKKHKKKNIEFGEGLIGAVAVEKNTMHITDVPDSYIEITSGLGKANPNAVLIVPLMREDDLYGIIELASFNKFENYQIEFIEKIGESIASTLYNTNINATTGRLLKQSQEQAEQMRTQEEEMRQNMEELNATQEEMERQQEKLKLRIEELENELELRSKEIDKYRDQSE